jgi:integrase
MTKRTYADRGRSIRQLASGNWQARYYDTKGERHSQAFSTKQLARDFLDRISADKQRGDYLDPRAGRTTLAEVAELWLSAKSMRQKTESTYRSILKTHIYPTFGSTAIAEINTLAIQKWIADMSKAERPLAAGTIHNAFRVLKGVLDAAVRAELRRTNPAAILGKGNLPRAEHREMHFLTAQEVKRLASQFEPPYELMIEFAVVTGMRAGEINALRWENVDLLRGKVKVAESISRVGYNVTVEKPKNNRTRQVPLTPEVTRQLRNYATVHPDFNPESYVWPDPETNDPRSPMNYSKHFYGKLWRPAVKAAGLPEALRFHDLRHTCASLLIRANIKPKAIQEHLGHATFAITMDRYGHLYADEAEAVTAALSEAFEY